MPLAYVGRLVADPAQQFAVGRVGGVQPGLRRDLLAGRGGDGLDQPALLRIQPA